MARRLCLKSEKNGAGRPNEPNQAKHHNIRVTISYMLQTRTTHLDLDDIHDLHTRDRLRVLPLGGKLMGERNVLGVSYVQELQLEH